MQIYQNPHSIRQHFPWSFRTIYKETKLGFTQIKRERVRNQQVFNFFWPKFLHSNRFNLFARPQTSKRDVNKSKGP